MPATQRARTIALRLAGLLAALTLACTSADVSDASPTPGSETSATAASSPTATATPRPPFILESPSPASTVDLARSRVIVDEVIEAVTMGDVDALEALVGFQEINCTRYTNGGPKPACDSDASSRAVPAFPAGVCATGWYRDPRPILERFVERAGPLFAVIEGTPDVADDGWIVGALPSGDLRVIFSARVEDQLLGYVAVVRSGVVTHLIMGCDSPVESLFRWVEDPPPIVLRGDGFGTPSPSPTTERPDPRTAPRGERTGIEHLDRVLDSVASSDEDAIRSILAATRMQCTHQLAMGSPPPCEADELEATVVDAFLLVGCEGGWARPDLDPLAAGLADQDLALYLVSAPRGSDNWYELLYVVDVLERPILLWVSAGGVIGRASICSTAEQWAERSHVILRGPAWPEDAASAE